MKIPFIKFLSFVILTSCELPQAKVQENQDSDKQTQEKTSLPNTISEEKIAIIEKKTSNSKIIQNKDKSFNDIQSQIIYGRPKHSFPPEDLLK